MHEVQSSTIEAEIARLESGIRQLKIQYDMFFAGAVPREPSELRDEIARLIRRTSNLPIRKYAHRFHLNSLVSRYNSMSELWGKTMRSREEGDRPPAQTADRRTSRGGVCVLGESTGGGDEFALRHLHREFVDARRQLDPEARAIPYDRFVAGIRSQADKLRRKSGCGEVELRIVVEGGAAQLKARPGRS